MSVLPVRRVHNDNVHPPSDQVYLQAAAVFQRLRTEKPVTCQLLHYLKKTDTPLPESGDKPTEEQAYQLAFSTLKYQDLLEDMMTDSCFHTSQHIAGDLLPLAMVMLFDFQDRRFSLRSAEETLEAVQEVRDLERGLQRCKTKLAASLARCRVKHSLQSVSCFLSRPVRTKQHRAKRLPLYAWINTLKTRLDEVCAALQAAGLSEAGRTADLKDGMFCRDPLCSDTLVFSHRLLAALQHSSVAATHTLNIQDRSVCVAVSVLSPLLFDKGDVLAVGSFSAVTVAHVAVAAAARSGRVLVCGADHTPSQVREMQELLAQMDIKNVRFLSEAFRGLSEWDASVHRLKVIIVLPQCSCSGLSDPVATIHSEHGDWDLLPHLSTGSVSKSKIQSLTQQQAQLLGHALSFPKVQTVVYCTRSVYPEENEQLVKRVLEKTHTHPKLLPFRANGPIFPDDSPTGGTSDVFFRLSPSLLSNGCFIARLSRQADPTKVETVQDVLARAAAKGLLGGIIPDQSKTGKKGKNKKNRAASASSKPSSPSSQGGQSGEELANGRDPEGRGEGGGFGDSDEEEDERLGENQKGKKKKRKGTKQSKQGKRNGAVSKRQSKNHKKKTAKKKVKESHQRRRKARRIPRLTLTLMSSAQPSSQLTPITALAHKLSSPPVHTVQSPPSTAAKQPSPPRPPKPTPPKRQNALPARTGIPAKDPPGAVRKAVRLEDEEAPLTRQRPLKAAGLVLPPISSPSSCSLRSSLSRTSNSQLNMSASSSSVSLPGL
ncbi:putative methyltransferase NSUN7 [Salarias fasciatus]|uniref:putative methyltransferase NSUN7 n=1 Tax=Salarias fasciatus TaxID=181472 RepID=UPI001176EAE9|nr:putative methyltransferase NSUN7 [Salarias fasciatus]